MSPATVARAASTTSTALLPDCLRTANTMVDSPSRKALDWASSTLSAMSATSRRRTGWASDCLTTMSASFWVVAARGEAYGAVVGAGLERPTGHVAVRGRDRALHLQSGDADGAHAHRVEVDVDAALLAAEDLHRANAVDGLQAAAHDLVGDARELDDGALTADRQQQDWRRVGSSFRTCGGSMEVGRSRMTVSILLRTSCAAMSTSRSIANCTMTSDTPSLLIDVSCSMPPMASTALSILSVTSVSTASGEEPG